MCKREEGREPDEHAASIRPTGEQADLWPASLARFAPICLCSLLGTGERTGPCGSGQGVQT